MDWFIILFMLFANIVAALLIYHSFGKDMDNEKKIKYSLIIIGGLYIITLVIYLLSGIGVGKIENAETARSYLMMAFVPINAIIIIPFTIFSCMKTKRKEITVKQLNSRLLIVEVVAVLLIIVEFIYFRNYQKGLKEITDIVQNSTQATSENTEIVENTENIENVENKENTEDNNTVVNEVVQNSEQSLKINTDISD